jgi:DNA invertase Pin-like site-specific DNA recombinase
MDNINLQTKKIFLYARKSTDEPERQVLSIEAQMFELREYAKKEGLNIVREFVESKTVLKPLGLASLKLYVKAGRILKYQNETNETRRGMFQN